MNHPSVFTVITGASQGLGRALAIANAKRGRHLVLLSLPNENLPAFAQRLAQKYRIQVLHYETDLTQPDAPRQFFNWIKTRNLHVNALINNAGIGGTALFESASTAYIDNIILLNIRALAMLTHLFVPELRQHPDARILNISSLAAFSPIPFKTVYPASKAFVYSFSLGLHEELRRTSIRVSVLHPGPIETTAEKKLRLAKHGFWAKLSTLTTTEIAEIALQEMQRGKLVIIPGWLNKINYHLLNWTPHSLRLRILGRVFTKELNVRHAR